MRFSAARMLQVDLFSDNSLQEIAVPDGKLFYLPALPLPLPPGELMQRLVADIDWRAETVTVFGRRHLQPRLTAWHGDKAYRYSGLSLAPQPWTPLLSEVRRTVEQASGTSFNSVLLNYYRNERDSMGMHADDEPELGPDPVIASLSLGAVRTFSLRHRRSGQVLRLPLASGSLLVMAGSLQAHWLHGIAKSTRPTGPRLNLTFRNIV